MIYKITTELTEEDVNVVKNIVEKTSNTWQGNRTSEEKFLDGLYGKIAERSLKNFLIKEYGNDFCLPNLNLSKDLNDIDINKSNIAFYDDFRQDNFNQHNDIDLIIAPNNSLLLLSINRIIEESNARKTDKYFSLSDNLKEKLRLNNILIGEVKSTRITERHKTNNIINEEKILSDDFLDYPKFLRSTNEINFNEEDYFSYVKTKYPNMSYQELLEEEKLHLKDFYIRIYVDEIKYNNESSKYSGDCYIVSAITNKNFIKDKLNIKKMPKFNKSENALYLSTPLKNGIDIKQFLKFKIPNNKEIGFEFIKNILNIKTNYSNSNSNSNSNQKFKIK